MSKRLQCVSAAWNSVAQSISPIEIAKWWIIFSVSAQRDGYGCAQRDDDSIRNSNSLKSFKVTIQAFMHFATKRIQREKNNLKLLIYLHHIDINHRQNTFESCKWKKWTLRSMPARAIRTHGTEHSNELIRVDEYFRRRRKIKSFVHFEHTFISLEWLWWRVRQARHATNIRLHDTWTRGDSPATVRLGHNNKNVLEKRRVKKKNTRNSQSIRQRNTWAYTITISLIKPTAKNSETGGEAGIVEWNEDKKNRETGNVVMFCLINVTCYWFDMCNQFLLHSFISIFFPLVLLFFFSSFGVLFISLFTFIPYVCWCFCCWGCCQSLSCRYFFFASFVRPKIFCSLWHIRSS